MKSISGEVFIRAAVFLSLLLFSTLVFGQETVPKTVTGQKPIISYGVYQANLTDVDPKDALAAFKVWIGEIGLERGYQVNATLFETTEELERALRDGVIQLSNTSTLDFFKIQETVGLEPLLGEVVNGSLGRRFLVLVRSDGPITDLEGLKGKSMFVKARDDLAMLFFNTILLRSMASEAAQVLASLQAKQKYSQCLMAVFFKQADACLVPEEFFRTMIDLNPQIGRDLKVLVQSPCYVDRVTFVSKRLDKKLRTLFIDESQKLRQTQRGRQLLMLFKVDDVRLIQESDLESVKSLVREYEALKLKKTGSSGSGVVVHGKTSKLETVEKHTTH
jgi:ABC-type phosphate/phosphonate transport system substrate-binding protein